MAIRDFAPSALVAASLCLPSCAPEDPSALPGRIEASARQFSAEDKRVAQSLSLGKAPTAAENANPYAEALGCSVALEAMSQRFAQAGTGDAHMVAIGQAEAIYARRAAQLARDLDKSTEELASDRNTRAAEIPELRDRGLLAIRCLRQLA